MPTTVYGEMEKMAKRSVGGIPTKWRKRPQKNN